MNRSICLNLLAAATLLLAGCAELKWPAAPVFTVGAGGARSASVDRAAENRQVSTLLAEVPRLIDLGADEARREQQAATAAYAADGSDANRVRLAFLLALGVGGRNDVKLLSLLDDTASSRPVAPDSPLWQFCSMLQRMTLERIQAGREAQARTDSRLRETELRLKDAQAKADDLQQKLDAMLNIEHKLNKRTPKREQP